MKLFYAMNNFVPIIRIIGFPWAGESTLAKKLAKELKTSCL